MKIEKIARVLGKSGLRALLGKALRWSGVVCLNYHRIGDGARSVFDSASSDAFDDQVRFLKTEFDVVVPDDLPDILARGKGRYLLITFDDGYADNYRVAFPILKGHQTRATFFVCTGFLDNGGLSWWDEIAWMARTSPRNSVRVDPWVATPVIFDEPEREQAVWTLLKAYKTMPTDSNEAYLRALAEATGTGRWCGSESEGIWMTWDMVREMRAAGMSFGGHTINHPILAQMSPEQQWREIFGCGARLGEELGEPMRCFSYPVGGIRSFNDDTRRCLAKAGVRYAFSYYGGFRHFNDWDNYDIRRIAIESCVTPDFFRAMVTLPQFFGRIRE